MKHIKKLLFIVMLVGAANAQSQITFDILMPEYFKSNAHIMRKFSIEKSYHDIEGSAFFDKEWKKGFVTFTDNKKTPEIPMALDTYKNAFYFKNKEEVYEVNNFTNISSVTLDGHKFIKVNLNVKKGALVEVVYENKFVIYKHHFTKLSEGKPSNGIVPATKDKFNNYARFYLNNGSSIKRFKLNTKNISKLLKVSKGSIKKYIKTNSLDLNNSKDLAKILSNFDN